MSCRHCLTIILHFSRKLTFTFSKIYFIESLSLYFLSTSLSHSTDNLASNLIGKIETIRWALFHNLITRSTKPSVPALISSFSPIIEVSLLLSAIPQYRSDSLWPSQGLASLFPPPSCSNNLSHSIALFPCHSKYSLIFKRSPLTAHCPLAISRLLYFLFPVKLL